MSRRPLKEALWFPNAVVACIAVVLYVFLTEFDVVWKAVSTFVGFFSPRIMQEVVHGSTESVLVLE